VATARIDAWPDSPSPFDAAAGGGRSDLIHLPVNLLEPSPDNPRQSPGDLSPLVASIRTAGVVQSLLVRPLGDGRYQIVCGERRWAAAREAGMTEVPCVVRSLTDFQRQEAMLIENLQRSSLSRLEEARAYERLLKMGFTQRTIATRVGKSQSHISRHLLLLSLPEPIRNQVELGEVPVDQALGYRSAPTGDVFAADEELQRAWIALREHVLTIGNRELVRLVRDFAAAYARRQQLSTRATRRSEAHNGEVTVVAEDDLSRVRRPRRRSA
jgi:ParB family chromosome partitioning protein